MEFEMLLTPRLQLRKIEPGSYEWVFENYDDPGISAFFGLQTAKALEDEKERYRQRLYSWNRSFLYFQMLQAGSGRLIGTCGYHTWYRQHRRAEMGYSIFHEEDKRKGFMKEALLPIVEYGFARMELNRIEAMIGPSNVASQRLVQHLGFEKEGLMRQHYCKEGVMEDSCIYSLLCNDHLKRSADHGGE